ncbi:SusC/RagA family TonB-linked outer membrane protein [Flavobacterium coralii]|uniref:SusC/RagA family TonB-linked outer membrane protein n=1 Tax=Flavobacterium coralii TaxID=2838017 RepID=UPI001F00005B|nr:SusC/RagA family TonB-linked outer membrane protein [Flavobacterium coralii]
MKRKLDGLLTLLIALTMQISFAQERAVTGTVTDQTGFPIPGANVVIKGSATGVQTDFDGKYEIQAAPDQVLVFSYIGMTTEERPATSTTIDVMLEDSATELETVVVTAVGIRREKSSLGAATTTLRSDEINEGSQNNISDAIKGKVAGVVISNASTDPGASSSVVIRGYSSLSGNNQPLYVVDGIPINNNTNFSDDLDGGYDFGRGSSDINPDDIESMTILKGAAASALYGARAANGAIIITTKKGKAGKLSVDFSTTTFFTQVLRTPKYQSTYGQGWDGVHYLNENGSWGPRFDGQPRVWGNVVNNSQLLKPYSFQEDQLRNFFDTGVSQLTNFAVSGGSGESSVRLSYSNAQQDGIYPTDADSYERNTVSLTGTTKIDKFTINASMNYVNTQGSSVATGQGLTVYNNLLQIPNDIPITEFADYNNPFHNVSNYYTPYGVTNPYFTLNENGSDYNKERVYASIELAYDLNNWSDFIYRFGVDSYSDVTRIWEARVDAAPGSPNDGSSTEYPGSYYEASSTFKQLNHDLLYNLDFDIDDNFGVVSTFGFNINSREGMQLAANVGSQDIPDFYSLANSSQVPTVANTRSLQKLYGLYNTTTFSYKEQLFLTGNVRNDWYSTLPEANRSSLYAGANASWVFSRTFPEINNIINYGKLRVGYGEGGNDTDPYQVYADFVQGSAVGTFGNLTFPINGLNAYEVGNRAPNLDLKPERRKEFEVGMELSLFDNRITIDATYYDARVENQILPLPLAPSTGYTNQVANLGTISNKGIEALVNFSIFKNRDGFNWDTSVNFTTNDTKLEELDPRIEQVELGGLSTLEYIAKPGQTVGLIQGYVPERDPDGNIVVDANGVPIASPIKEVYGDTQYDYTMGITNNFEWKGISLGFTFDIRQGGLMYSRTADITRFTGNSITTMYNDRQPFIVPNSVVRVIDESTGEVSYSQNTTAVDREHMDDYYRADALARATVIDKSFIKLREVVLSYRFPTKYLEGTFIQGLTCSVIGRNLFLWTPASNQYIDPEVSTFGTQLAGQFGEFSANPSTRSLGFSLKANF